MYLPRSINSSHMLRDKARRQLRAKVHRVAVVVGLAGAQIIAPLPEGVGAHAVGGERERRLLPGALDGAA